MNHGAQTVTFWNLAEKREETEQIYGESLMRWLYGSRSGQWLADWVLTRKPPSKLYGMYQDSALSHHKIRPFINQFNIKMEEFERTPYKSFNDFFIRKFKPGARVFSTEPNRMPAFAEARYLAYENTSAGATFPIKGKSLTPASLLGDVGKAERFIGGPLLIARLCPTDYHRFHYPDAGRTIQFYKLGGRLHSVNPIALEHNGGILSANERHVSILETGNFGRVAYVEVGALFVGRIEQTYGSERPFKRGDEKGYFLFGGSTAILLGEPGAWKPVKELLEQTAQGRETFVKLGEPVATV